MKIAFRIVIGVVLLAVIAAGALVWYVSPQERLDFAYTEVDFEQKLRGMITSMKSEMMLSEWEINQFMKQWLSEYRRISDDLEMTGMRSEVHGEQLKLWINLKYMDLFRIGLNLTYRLAWNHPNFVATLEQASIRNLRIPTDRIPLQEIVFPVAGQLPDWVAVKDVSLDQGRIWIRFQLDRAYIEENLLP